MQNQRKLNKINRTIKTVLAAFFVVITLVITYLPTPITWDDIYAAVGLRDKTCQDFDPRPLTVSFIDVGQGDSCFIWTENTTILIDTGPEDNAEKILTEMKKFDITELDYLIITHNHSDHIGSLEELKYLLNKNDIEIKNEIIPDDETIMSDFTLTPEEDLSLRFLGPIYRDFENINNMSLVIKMTYKDTSFLFAGDAEEGAESSLLRRYSAEELDCDVLKVGHHGSTNSSSEAFLSVVTPKIAVISVGEANDYGHPHALTLKRLATVGATIYRTDECGTIHLTTDGKNIVKN